jgi:hypothetical protein
LGGNDGLHEGRSPGGGDKLSLPNWELASHLVNNKLEVSTPKTMHRQREPQVSNWERGAQHGEPLENALNIDIGASNGDNRTLLHICNKPGDLSKSIKDAGERFKILSYGGQKNDRIIGI